MKIQGKDYQTIWVNPADNSSVQVIDQRKLPFEFSTFEIHNEKDAYFAIQEMVVRGAPLIGVTAAYGLYLAIANFEGGKPLDELVLDTANYLKSARPTAVNLANVIDRAVSETMQAQSWDGMIDRSFRFAQQIKQKETDASEKIGEYGLELIRNMAEQKNSPVNILTHCNAGWLACIDWGTATAPIYKAFLAGIDIHVWVDETRPRNQGARLTAYELGEMGVPHTVIPDNTGGHLMQHNMVDLVIVGSDRTTMNGDVANKIGTYLKALAANDNSIPFYVALPTTTFDTQMRDGIKNIPIEQRSPKEVSYMEGLSNNKITEVRIMPENSPVANYGFDVTPARLVSALITEKGICEANETAITKLLQQ